MVPETLYSKTSDDVWIAYQVVGDGATDLIIVKSWVSHLEVYWEQPRFAAMVRRSIRRVYHDSCRQILH
jgi:hypothetical protein